MKPAGPHVAIVGAGVSGLAAAHRLRTLLGPDATITVLERARRVGGVLHTVDFAGLPYDVGAEAFLARRPEVPALAAELGLSGELVEPSAAAPLLRVAGQTMPLPRSTLLGVPASSARLDGVLSAKGVAQVAAEPGLPLRWVPGSDVALGALLRPRFGNELVDRLVEPLLGGVYAGRVDALGLRATMPALAAALDVGAPSLTAAATHATRPTGEFTTSDPRVHHSGTASSPPTFGAGLVGAALFGALRGGFRVLLDALVAAAGVELRLGATVRELQRRPSGWRVVFVPVAQGITPAPAETLEVDAVLLAVPAPALRRLLTDVAPTAASAAGEIELASSAVVSVAYRATDATALPDASGVLVACGEPMSSKALTFSTRKWPHLAGNGLVRLRASLGRHGEADTLQVSDKELLTRVRTDLAVLTGITALPVASHVQRWGGGLPQYGVGHLDRVSQIERGIEIKPRLAVAGALLAGVGVPACIATARTAAERIVAQIRASSEADRATDPV